MISRILEKQLLSKMDEFNTLILTGPCRVGKTALLQEIRDQYSGPVLWWDGDEPGIRTELEEPTATSLREKIGGHTLLVIDNAHRLENVNSILPLFHQFADLKVIASSAISLPADDDHGHIAHLQMLPISTQEMINHTNLSTEKSLLKHRLIYGYYPEVLSTPGKEQDILKQFCDHFIFQHILAQESIQKSARFEKLVQVLALRTGKHITVNELAQTTGLDFHTVNRYLSLLEKSFVIFQIMPFSRNLDSEIKKIRKIYFYDNGIRNALINQFNPFKLRQDQDALWENFLMSERLKVLSHNQKKVSRFFWRTHSRQEIDYIEEDESGISAFQFSWNPAGKARFSKSFTNEYSPQKTQIVHRDNYLRFASIPFGSF